jgi:hypothetical protein
MTDARRALLELIEKGADADLVRELLAFASERLMAAEVDQLTGAGSVVGGGDAIAAERKEVVDLIMRREEPLCLAGRFEPLHPPFASSCRLVRVFRSVVQALVPAVLDPGHQLLLRRAVTGELIRDHDARRPHLLLQQLAQQALGRVLVASAPHQHIEHDAVLVDRPPQPVPLAGDGDGDPDLIEVSLVAGTG